jgi:hypothetical protein
MERNNFQKNASKELVWLVFFALVCCSVGKNLHAQESVGLELYGWKTSVAVSAAQKALVPKGAFNEEKFAQSLKAAVGTLAPLAADLNAHASRSHFNDWLKFKLAVALVKKLWKGQDAQSFAAAALVRAMGYNADLVLMNKRLYLAVQLSRKIYFGAIFTQESGEIFGIYDVECGEFLKKLPSPSLEFFDATQTFGAHAAALNLDIEGFPTLPEKIASRKIKWTFQQKPYTLELALNKNLVDYLEGFPQMEVDWYFNRPLTSAVQAQIVEPLQAIIRKNKWSGRDAVNFLLQFCLDGFKYKDDAKTTRGEHCNFVEETLLSDYCDCEDRAVLLSAIVQGVLGYDVVGLQLPNHISAAVHLNHEPPSAEPAQAQQRYDVDGKVFLSCDPSLMNSEIGDVNPLFKNMTPERIIRVEKVKFAR